ncbi:hypothetical protein SORBI_3001G494350 [Sorghum bicolor]|uniref:Uncharacterized protein n=1 Tax=Sorghum bicolor TaxID=4558 RepID=A0A1Z5SB87_SORBI|nr:hypothetical protein SORBI_3001G494350 [Sorghum bicolor]
MEQHAWWWMVSDQASFPPTQYSMFFCLQTEYTADNDDGLIKDDSTPYRRIPWFNSPAAACWGRAQGHGGGTTAPSAAAGVVVLVRRRPRPAAVASGSAAPARRLCGCTRRATPGPRPCSGQCISTNLASSLSPPSLRTSSPISEAWLMKNSTTRPLKSPHCFSRSTDDLRNVERVPGLVRAGVPATSAHTSIWLSRLPAQPQEPLLDGHNMDTGDR